MRYPHTGQNGHLKICSKINARDGVERRECSCTVVGNVQWRSCRENSMESLKKQNREVPSDPAILCLGIHPEKTNILKDTGTPTICSPPGLSVPGVSQARRLEWVAMPSFRGSFEPRDRTQVSCIAGRFFTVWATREAPLHTPLQTRG